MVVCSSELCKRALAILLACLLAAPQKSVDLTEQQKHDTVEMKRAFLRKIEPVMEERKALNMQIQANLPHDTFATKNALTYIKVRHHVPIGSASP